MILAWHQVLGVHIYTYVVSQCACAIYLGRSVLFYLPGARVNATMDGLAVQPCVLDNCTKRYIGCAYILARNKAAFI